MCTRRNNNGGGVRLPEAAISVVTMKESFPSRAECALLDGSLLRDQLMLNYDFSVSLGMYSLGQGS